MEYRRILYRSRPCYADYDHSDLDILRISIQNNRRQGITGYLWRANQQFFQALHGPSTHLNDLMQRLANDDRHTDIEILMDRASDGQSPFSEWSMGYDHFGTIELALDPDENGKRPVISPKGAEVIYNKMIESAADAISYGTAFPYSRRAHEAEDDYLARINSMT